MNWDWCLNALFTVVFIYANVFGYLYSIAYTVKEFKDKNAAVNTMYWGVVKAIRFLWPVRKFMLLIYIVEAIIKSHFSIWTFIGVVWFFYLAFFAKDDFGDDDRQKKPSKVKSFVKSLGHRLVEVPA